MTDEDQTTEDMKSIIHLYSENANRFTKVEEMSEDIEDYLQKITKRYKQYSQKYNSTIENAVFHRHYPSRQTYARATFFIPRRNRQGVEVKLAVSNMIKTRRGVLYFTLSPGGRALNVFTSHVFDRYAERVLKRQVEDADYKRSDLIFKILDLLSSAVADDSPRILHDEEFDSVHTVVDDGYLVGQSRYFEHGAGTDDYKLIKVFFYKTFLSHAEVSDGRMERLMELYKEEAEAMKREGPCTCPMCVAEAARKKS